MARNELVHVTRQEVVRTANVPLETTKDFCVFGKEHKPKRNGAKLRGRPRVYNGTQRRQVAAALKVHGLTKGLKYLKKEKKLKVSLTLARSVAEEFGITFQRGRPIAA